LARHAVSRARISAVGEGAMAVSFIHASLDVASPAKDASTPAA